MSLPTDPPCHPAPFTRWAHDPARSIDERYLVWVLCRAVQTALEAFRTRYRKAIEELDQKLGPEDPRWYDFGLNRPADPATSGVPTGVELTALGGSSVLVEIDGARRANSFNYYRQVMGVDAEPVKVINTEGEQHTLTDLPVGAIVSVTVTGVNDAGEGPPSAPVTVVVE